MIFKCDISIYVITFDKTSDILIPHYFHFMYVF